MSIKHRTKLPIIGRGFILFLAANFIMFGNCLGVLDSCAGIDFVEQDYEILQTNPLELYSATTANFGNDTFDLNAPSPDEERIVLLDTHSQVNPLLAPKLTAYAKKTPDQKERARVNRRIRDQKKQLELKRKTKDSAALGRSQKARKDLECTVTDLKSENASYQHSGRGSAESNANKVKDLRAQRVSDASDRLKEKAEAKKIAKEQAEDHALTITKLEEKFENELKAKDCQITKLCNNLFHAEKDWNMEKKENKSIGKKSTTKERGKQMKEREKLFVALRAESAEETAAIKKQSKAAKTQHRAVQEELLLRNEKHRVNLAKASQGTSDYYEGEVADLHAALEVPDLETKVKVDGDITREWGIHYWLGSMKSMMHATPAVTLKLWDYCMDYVEATSPVKRSKDWSPPTRKHLAELRTDAGLVGQICAGVTVAKAKSLLTVFIDETELECSSMQSMITTIVDESDRVKSVALDGVKLLKKKHQKQQQKLRVIHSDPLV